MDFWMHMLLRITACRHVSCRVAWQSGRIRDVVCPECGGALRVAPCQPPPVAKCTGKCRQRHFDILPPAYRDCLQWTNEERDHQGRVLRRYHRMRQAVEQVKEAPSGRRDLP